MRITTIAAASMISAAAMIGLAATAHADTSGSFQSASGNIGCGMRLGSGGKGGVTCAVRDHTWVIVAPVPKCPAGYGDWEFDLDQGNEPGPSYSCAVGTIIYPGQQTLDYGQTRTAGTITCDSEPTGVTCTDTSTGHFFRVSRESYQLG